MAEYYRQRAGAGLIITEGTWPNDESVGFVNVPGMFTKQQSDSWKKVTNSVHEHGGKIFSQLVLTKEVVHGPTCRKRTNRFSNGRNHRR